MTMNSAFERTERTEKKMATTFGLYLGATCVRETSPIDGFLAPLGLFNLRTSSSYQYWPTSR